MEHNRTNSIAAVLVLLAVMLGELLFCAPVSAEGTCRAVLADYDDSLTTSQESELLELMRQTANKIECNVGVVITDNLNGKTDNRYADDFLDDSFGRESSSIVLLLLNTNGNPEYKNYGDWISTSGRARDYYDRKIDDVFDAVYDGLDSGGFGKAVEGYCDYLSEHDSATFDLHFDSDYVISFFLAVVIGIVVAILIVKGITRTYKLKKPISASAYLDDSRTSIIRREDVFVREFTTSHRMSSSSHGGHGGGSHSSGGHGGGGGSHSSGGHGGGGGHHR